MRITTQELTEAIEKLPPPKEFNFPQIAIEIPERIILNTSNSHGKLEPEKKIFFDKDDANENWLLEIV